MPTHITSRSLAALKPGESIRDTEREGFVARKDAKHKVTFFYRLQGRKRIYKKLGRDIPLATARTLVERLYAETVVGTAYAEPVVDNDLTLLTAWPEFREHLVTNDKSPATITSYEGSLARLSDAIKNAPLRVLSQNLGLMGAEFKRIATRTDDGTAHRQRGHGRTGAIAAARFVRACYRFTLRTDDNPLPARLPTVKLNLKNPKPQYELPVLEPEQIPAWWRLARALDDPIRRECYLFCLLSGLRRTSLLTMRWADRDRDDGAFWKIPRPKGGEDKEFDLVLSAAMMACVRRALVLSNEWLTRTGEFKWLWPGTSDDGHVPKLNDREHFGDLWMPPHGLRRTYSSVARLAGSPEDLIERFLNHGKESVTRGYIMTNPIGALLRESQERTSTLMLKFLADETLVPEPEDAASISQKDLAEMIKDAFRPPR